MRKLNITSSTLKRSVAAVCWFFALLSSPLLLKSQTDQAYQPMLVEGREWTVYFWNTVDYFVNPYSGARQYILGDTIIGRTKYKKIWERYLYSVAGVGVFVRPFGISQQRHLWGYMREDSLERKIYARPAQVGTPLPIEYLAYDFSLKPGDSLSIPYLMGLKIKLLGITSFTLPNGDKRREFEFEYPTLRWRKYTYIEGLGGYASLTMPFDFPFERGSNVGCVRLPQAVTLPNPYSYGCETIVGVTEQQAAWPQRIVYDQQSAVLRFDAPISQTYQLTIWDMQGRRWRTHIDYHTDHSLPVGELSTGLYIVQLLDAEGRFKHFQWIKM